MEGVHGRAKTQHGLRRAVRRGLANVGVQSYLTAPPGAVMNIKRLAKALSKLFLRFLLAPKASKSLSYRHQTPIRFVQAMFIQLTVTSL